MFCGRRVALTAPAAGYQRALRDPNYRPVCDACGRNVQTESSAATGLNPQMLDALDMLLTKNPKKLT